MKLVNQHFILVLLAALLFGAVLVACGGEEPTPTPPPADSDDDNPPAEPTDEPMPEPTDEPEPTEEPTPTPEPTETPDPTAGFADFSNDVLGISFSYPGDWVFEFDEEGGEVNLASSQEALDSVDDRIAGAVLNVLMLDTELLGFLGGSEVDTTDPAAVLGIFTDLIAGLSGDDETFDLVITDEPTAVSINGQEAAEAFATATSEDGDEATVKLVAILAGARAAFVFSGAESSVEAEFRPLLDAVENSILLSEPTGAAAESVDMPESSGLLLFGDTVSGVVDETGPSVWNFVGLAGEVVDIVVVPEGDFDVVVDVVDGIGTSILPNGEVDQSFGQEDILGVTIPADGNYSILVRGFAEATGNYQLTFAEAGTAVAPVGGDGASIAYGDFVSGSVDSATPVVSYSFFGAEDDVVGLVVTPFDDFDVVVDVVDEAGNSLLSRERDASFGSENVIVSLPADGVYAINIYGFEGSTGSFDMQFGFPLTNVVLAAPDTLDAEDEGEGHSFPFTALRAGDMVGIYVEPFDDLDVAIQVRKGDDLISGLGFDPERGFDSAVGEEEFVMIVDETDTYSFRVLNSQDDFAGNTGEYEVALFGTPEVVFELAYGDFVDARTNEEGLVDYVISGLVGDTMVVNVLSDDDSVDMVIEILDLDENLLASIDDGFSGEEEVLAYTFASEELVIIRVSDFFGGEGDFVMSVELQ